MIIDYDHNPNISADQKLQSLKESVQMALNEAEAKASTSGLIDMFYPVGSYYETSDTSFDPNISWGGTWSLETAGQVHVSAGTGYIAGSTGGDVTKSYTPAGSIGNTTLSNAQMAHGHGFTQPTVKTPALTANNSNYVRIATEISSIRRQMSGTDGGSYRYLRYEQENSSIARGAPTIAAGQACTVTGGAVANLSGASSTRTGHNHGWTGTAANINVMQPYIAVNRWHRTA